jgi:hypothetical protein
MPARLAKLRASSSISKHGSPPAAQPFLRRRQRGRRLSQDVAGHALDPLEIGDRLRVDFTLAIAAIEFDGRTRPVLTEASCLARIQRRLRYGAVLASAAIGHAASAIPKECQLGLLIFPAALDRKDDAEDRERESNLS